jgi:hypothetical protein
LAAAVPPSAHAQTFRPLEALRILNQEAADNLKYDGELAPITGQPNSPTSLLVPIRRIDALLKEVRAQVDTKVADPSQWEAIRLTLSSPPLSKKEFKQAFNAFADNIYYVAGSERANAYLIGGAAPSTQQTTQYLWRNEILSNVETAVLELDYLIKLRDKGATSREALVGEELDDLRGFLDEVRVRQNTSNLTRVYSSEPVVHHCTLNCAQALKVMKQYLGVASQGDSVNAARLKREASEWFNESP